MQAVMEYIFPCWCFGNSYQVAELLFFLRCMRINMMVLIIDNALVMTGINDEQSGHYVSLLGATVDRKFFSLNCSAGSCHIGGPP